MTGVSVASLPSPPTRTSWSTFCRAHHSGVRCDSGEKIHEIEGRDQKKVLVNYVPSARGRSQSPNPKMLLACLLALMGRCGRVCTAVARVMPCSAHCEPSHLLGHLRAASPIGALAPVDSAHLEVAIRAISVHARILTFIWRKKQCRESQFSRDLLVQGAAEGRSLARRASNPAMLSGREGDGMAAWGDDRKQPPLSA